MGINKEIIILSIFIFAIILVIPVLAIPIEKSADIIPLYAKDNQAGFLISKDNSMFMYNVKGNDLFFLHDNGKNIILDFSKTDRFLKNKEFLIKEGYLIDNEVPVIISLNVPKITPNKGTLSTTSVFVSAKSRVSAVLDKISNAPTRDLRLVNAISTRVPLEKIKELEASPDVKKVWLDKKVYITLDESIPLINADDVWLLQKEGFNITGKDIEIAILDTGIDNTHPDLDDLDDDPLTDDPKLIMWKDFTFDNFTDPIDDNGHGTHCAGIAAGTGNASDGQYTGVAPQAKLWGGKVLYSSGSGWESEIIAGIQWATDPNSDEDYSDAVDIISMSLGRDFNGKGDDPLSEAVNTAVDNGVVVVISAGNSGSSLHTVGEPGVAEKPITVGASDKSDFMAWFSSRGPTGDYRIKPDVTAPGVEICSANSSQGWLGPERGGDCGNDYYYHIDGTSMAAPHVAGAAALILQMNPDWTPEMVKSALMISSKDLDVSAWSQGAGRIDVERAIEPLILSYPSSISFGIPETDIIEKEILIQNMNTSDITVSLDAGLMVDEDGNEYDISSLNTTSLDILEGENGSVLLTIDATGIEGYVHGYLKMTVENEEYRIPYAFIRMSQVTLYAVNGTEELSPAGFAIHKENGENPKYVWQGWGFFGNSYTFLTKSGDYTIEVIGEEPWSDIELNYILVSNIKVPKNSEVEHTFDLADAKKVTITTRDLDDTPLALEKWGFSMRCGVAESRAGPGMFFGGFGFTDNRVVYVSDQPCYNQSYYFEYAGVPARGDEENDRELFGESWGGSEEVYFMGWKVNGAITEDTTLGYTEEELIVFDQYQNYPGAVPFSTGEYHEEMSNVIFWSFEEKGFDLSAWRFSPSPLNRTLYFKTDENQWSFGTFDTYNYLNDPDIWDDDFDWRVFEEIPFIKPTEERDIYFGTPPYSLPHFSNSEFNININGYFIKGYEDTTNLYGYSEYPNEPEIKLYNNTGSELQLIYEDTIPWHDFWYTMQTGSYETVLTITPKYSVFNTITITGTFDSPSTDYNPPALLDLEIAPLFEKDKELELSFKVTDDVDVVDVTAYYSTDLIGWTKLPLTKAGDIYNSVITISDSSSGINLLIKSTDTSENAIAYEITPVSLLAHPLTMEFEANVTEASPGQPINFSGKLTDPLKANFTGVRIEYLVNGEVIDYDQTDFHNEWFETEVGEFEIEWTVPEDYMDSYLNFTAVFEGTGIYLPVNKTVKISMGQDIAWSDEKTNPLSPAAYSEDRVYQFNITWTGPIDDVIFEWNETNYTPSKDDNVYYKELSDFAANKYEYRWYANSTEGAWNSTALLTYEVSKATPPVIMSVDPGWTVIEGTKTKIDCTCDTGQVTVKLYRDGSKVSIPDVKTLSVGNYFYECKSEETENYTSYSISNTLYVNKETPPPPPLPPLDVGEFYITGIGDEITVDADASYGTTFTVKNTHNYDIQDVDIFLDGLPTLWYSLSNSHIDEVSSSGEETVGLTLNIPKNTERTYSIKLRAEGTTSGGTVKKAEKTITLNINPVYIIQDRDQDQDDQEDQEPTPTGYFFADPTITAVGFVILFVLLAIGLRYMIAKMNRVRENNYNNYQYYEEPKEW